MGALSFNEMEIDALGEMMNISLGASATAMSTLLGSTVHITTPKVKILTRDQFEFKKLEPAVGVEIAYVEGLIIRIRQGQGNPCKIYVMNFAKPLSQAQTVLSVLIPS